MRPAEPSPRSTAEQRGGVGFPSLQRAEIDVETVVRLFDDLEALARVVEVRVKQTTLRHADERPVDLATARRLFLAAEVRGIQVIYRYAARLWCDTLLCREGRVHLLRMERGMEDERPG